MIRDETPRRSPATLVVASGAVVLVVALVALFLARTHNSDSEAAPTVSWSRVGDVPVPSSQLHGPRQTANGLASGFSHDILGAALAAVHINYRVLPSAPRHVSEETVRRQCFGDVAGYLDRLERFVPTSTAPLPGLPSAEFHYRVVSGDPTGPFVRVAIAGTLDAGARGYVETVRTLRWVDGDWRMELPLPRPTLISSLDGYTLLGKLDG